METSYQPWARIAEDDRRCGSSARLGKTDSTTTTSPRRVAPQEGASGRAFLRPASCGGIHFLNSYLIDRLEVTTSNGKVQLEQ